MFSAYDKLVDRSVPSSSFASRNKMSPVPSHAAFQAVAHHAIMALTFVVMATTVKSSVWVAVLGALVTYPSWRMLFMTTICIALAVAYYRPAVVDLMMQMYHVLTSHDPHDEL